MNVKQNKTTNELRIEIWKTRKTKQNKNFQFEILFPTKMAHFYSQNDLDISSINSLLKNFTNDELDSILNDQSNERIEDFIRDLPQIKTLERERERLIEENKQIAENNLSFESTYRIQRQQLTKAFDECQ